MSGFLVTAPLVIAKDQSGRLHHAYQGTYLPWLGTEQRDHFLRHGLVEQVDEKDAVEAGVVPVDALVEKPKKTATKEEWVKYGVSKGNDRGELENLTRDELVDLLGDF